MKILDTESNNFLSNNSLLRGEQVFTSLLFYCGKILFLDQHLKRLIMGADFLFPQCDWKGKELDIKNALLERVSKLKGNSYLRLTIIEDIFFIITKEHEVSDLEINIVKSFQTKTPSLRPSYLKLSQYADSLLEIKHASKSGAQDIIYSDQNNFVTEASTSNIFIVTNNNELKTPPASSMVLEGVLRSQLIKKFSALEQVISHEEILSAKEIWLTNSIKGLRFVAKYEDKILQRENSLFNSVIQSFGRYGEKI